jgi:diaminopimelate epimerase
MKGFPFSKMSGAGNDFIFVDHRDVPWEKWDLPDVARKICRRRISVGADGFVVVVPAKEAGNDFGWRFFNADGSEGEMCGNAARCVARFAVMKGIASSPMRFETLSGPIEARVEGERVRVRMGDPRGIRTDVAVLVPGEALSLVFMDTGVPHAVHFVPDVEGVDVAGMGRTLRYHDAFAPRGTNANFAQVIDVTTLKVRTYERGVEGETLACGTGAVASAVAAHLLGKVGSPVDVITRSGRILRIHFAAQGERYGEVYLEGDARLIYEGMVHPDALDE